MAPPKRPEDWLTIANRAPGAAPPPPSLLPPAQPAGPPVAGPITDARGRMPKGGDWDGHNKYVKEETAKEDLARLEGATFYDGPGAVGSGGGGAPVLISKGGRTPQSWTEQTAEGLKFSDETKQKADQAFESERSAVQEGMNAGQAQAAKEVAYLDTHEGLARQREQNLRDREARQTAALEQEHGKLEELVTRAREGKVDPERYWREASTGTKVSAAIGAMLGGIGQGLIGGKNYGLEALNTAISQDIQAQRDNIANNREKVSDRRGVLSEMRRTFGDETAAEAATWVSHLEVAKTQLARIAAESNSDAIRVRAQQQLAAIDKDQAGHMQRWEAATQDRVQRVQHDVNAPAQYAGGSGATEGLNHKEEEATRELSTALVKSGIPGQRADLDRLLNVIPKEGDVPGVGGIHGVTGLTGATKKLDNVAYNFFGSTQGQEIRQAAGVLFNRQLKDESGAAVSDQELERQEAAFWGARDAPSARRALQAYGNRLNQLEATIRSGANPKLNQIQRQRQASETKRLEPKKQFTGPTIK